MQHQLVTFVLAGGRGNRLFPLTEERAKLLRARRERETNKHQCVAQFAMKSVTSDRHQQAKPGEPGQWGLNTDNAGRFMNAEGKDRNRPSLRFGQSRQSLPVLSIGKRFSRRGEVNPWP